MFRAMVCLSTLSVRGGSNGPGLPALLPSPGLTLCWPNLARRQGSLSRTYGPFYHMLDPSFRVCMLEGSMRLATTLRPVLDQTHEDLTVDVSLTALVPHGV